MKKKRIENFESVSREELAHMAKHVKKALKLHKISKQKTSSRKGKKIDKSFKAKDKGYSKGKTIKCFNCEGLVHVSIDCPSPKDIKRIHVD